MAAGTVLDASALLAFLQGEQGSEVVRETLDGPCAISAVNLAEVLSKGAERGRDPSESMRELTELEDRLEIVQLEREDLISIAELRPLTRNAGVSLADRACLALARRLAAPVLTADRTWADLELDGIAIRLIR